MYNSVFGLPLNLLRLFILACIFITPFTIITNYKRFNKQESYEITMDIAKNELMI